MGGYVVSFVLWLLVAGQAMDSLGLSLKQTSAVDLDQPQQSVRRLDGLDGHVDYCKRYRKSSYKMPWERGLLGFECMPVVKPFVPQGAFPLKDSERVQGLGALDTAVDHPVSLPSCSSNVKLKKISNGMTWHEKLDSSRGLALKKWLTIVSAGGVAFGLVEQHYNVKHVSQILLIDAIEIALTSKSTSTLHTRAGPVLRYMKWCKDSVLPPFPMDSVVVFKFIDLIKCECAPTFPRSFLGSVAFMTYVLDMHCGKSILESSLISGLASSLFLKKRKTVQRPALKVWHVKRLESLACGKDTNNIIDQVAAGFFCYLIYARARFSDGQASGNFILDVIQGTMPPQGFIEAKIERSKTSFSLERKTRHLPMVAQITGLCDNSWALAWVRAMQKSGLQCGIGKPLLPAPLAAGEWDTVPISAEAATNWIRKLLMDEPTVNEDEAKYIMMLGTHSCKTTILSWAAKKGTDLQTRKIMGYHSLGKQNAVFIYGRDNISPALREISEIVKMVATKKFLPDCTRSGYFPDDGNCQEACKDVDEPTPEELRADSSSEDSADDDHIEHAENEAAIDEMVGEWIGNFDPEILPREHDRYLRHSVSRVFHLIGDESGCSLTCGRLVTKSYEALDVLPKVLHPVCKQCFSMFAKSC